MLEAAIFVIFPFCMVFAAISDMLSMTIANRVSLLLAGSFLVIAPLTGMDWTVYGMHIAAGALVLTVTFGLFAIGGMGGGDAKLLAATAIWMGWGLPLVSYILMTGVVGGLLTLAIVLFRGSAMSTLAGNNVFLRHLAEPKGGIPYGIALGIVGLLSFPQSPLAIWALAKVTAG